jgi:hypothetical protein
MAGLAMIGIAVLAMAALVTFRIWLPRPVCTASPKALYAVLLDSTSHLSEAQRLDLGNRLRSIGKAMPPGARLQFWKVAPTGDGVPVAVAEPTCRPDPDPNEWVQNKNQAQAALDKFNTAVNRQIDEAVNAPEQPESPILESVQAIWLRFLGSDQYDKDVERHLIVASDLVQNTPAISFYRRLPMREELRQNARYQALRVPLTGTDVTLLYMRQDDGIEAGRLIELWEWVLDDMGASLISVVRITG